MDMEESKKPIDAKPLRTNSSSSSSSSSALSLSCCSQSHQHQIPSSSTTPHHGTTTDTSMLASSSSSSSAPNWLSLDTSVKILTEPQSNNHQNDDDDEEYKVNLFGYEINLKNCNSSISSSLNNKSSSDSRKGVLPLFGNSIAEEDILAANANNNNGLNLELGIQETSKTINKIKRAYKKNRSIQIKRRGRTTEHPVPPPAGSYKPNIGQLLAEKILTKSDVDSSSRLLLSREFVEQRIIPILRQNHSSETEQLCKSIDGFGIQIYDADTTTDENSSSSYTLVLKRWKTNSYVFTGNWKKGFVKRRNLKENDQIAIFWDQTQQRFYFSLKQIRM
ncbi:hypothetical protein M9H77_08101 [Catharanthus roseus]|uniref:Uncharacterized protein n=1 Tax=Catharanthus roseus TaxID=4058 RepID=A0ACC0BWZ2_CATRO|nr:hypothetical protein M9H77_08101 [Catharanthus roseus]